jgi:hypothetical protein
MSILVHEVRQCQPKDWWGEHHAKVFAYHAKGSLLLRRAKPRLGQVWENATIFWVVSITGHLVKATSSNIQITSENV